MSLGYRNGLPSRMLSQPLPFDLIISDQSLPQFSGTAALLLAKTQTPRCPFIFFSGTMGEDAAVEALKNGAIDYITKDRPARLIAAIRRALQQAEETARRELIESQLFRTQRVESLGELAAGVAHDLKNILTPIMMSIELLENEAVSAEDKAQLLKTMKSSARRGAEVLNRMLTFTRGSASTNMDLEPAAVVAEIADLLGKVLPINIQLQVDAASPQYRFKANATQVHQVLMNLCVNARDAMPYGGIIKIRARSQTFQNHVVMGQAESVSGPFVGLSVSDSGHGMEPGVLSHIFEPFFTTKPPGLGTGLGLAIVTGVVRNHHGFLEVRSALRKGSTFTAWFPAIPDSPAATGHASGGTGQTILTSA